MPSSPHPTIFRSFEFHEDFDRPGSISQRGRTLSWQGTTISYPSPPMSSPPSPQRKSLDRPETVTASSPGPSFTSPPLPPISNVAAEIGLTTAPLPTTSAPSGPGSGSGSGSGSTTSVGIYPSTAGPVLTQQHSISSNEGSRLYRTESASSASNVPDVQAIAGPSSVSEAAETGRGGRKAKAHVANACGNCKHAHLSCDVERPCNRCVATGKADTCRDVPHKKRGRPRLRDEAEFRVQQPEISFIAAPQSSEAGLPTAAGRPVAGSRHRRQGSLRTLRASDPGMTTFGLAPQPSGPIVPFAPQPNLTQPPQTQVVPVAFLDLDLVIMKANAAFQQLIRGVQSIQGVRLSEIARPLEGDSFQNARNRLRTEREAKDPSYLPPILQGGIDPVSGITDANVEEVTRGFTDQHNRWTFRLASGTEHVLPVRVRLAKTTNYFVVLFLPALPAAQTQTEHFPPIAPGPPPQMFAPPAPGPRFQTSPPYLDPSLRVRDTLTQSAPPLQFYPYQSVGPQLMQTPTAGPSSRTYPPPDQMYPYHPPPLQYQPQYQQIPPFQSPRPSSSGNTGLPPIPERPPTAGSPGSTSHLFPVFPTTRPRSETMDSLGSHISRLRADSGATFPLPQLQSSPQRPLQTVARTSSSESVVSETGQSPKKRRKMGIDEVLQ